jgi:hypothetical protein
MLSPCENLMLLSSILRIEMSLSANQCRNEPASSHLSFDCSRHKVSLLLDPSQFTGGNLAYAAVTLDVSIASCFCALHFIIFAKDLH